jgi:NAD-dependent deacetylase
MSIEIRKSDLLFVLTGAGISAESGIPTFRGSGGMWDEYRLEELATPEAFEQDPELVWRFYSWRRSVAASCQPNPGHLALARLEATLGNRIVLCTQNVDSLHEAAGSKRALHMHGELFKSRCSNDSCKTEPFEDTKTYQQRSEIPQCGACGALLRPHICWFGEVPFHMKEVLIALKRCTVFLAVGTSGMVEPAASFAEQAAQNHARTYYAGLEEPANVDAFQGVFLGPAGERLPGVFDSR